MFKKLSFIGFFFVIGKVYAADYGPSIHTIETNGSTVTQRSTLNFVSGATIVDNSVSTRTDITITGGLVVIGTPTVNQEVVWNGTAAQWTTEGVSYIFSIASFADGQSGTIEEGVGVWKSSGTINFTAGYNNGPPIGSTITFSGWSALPLASPFTSTTSIANVNFPSVGGTVVFTLSSTNGTTNATASITHNFNNDRYWGVDTISSNTYSSADIRALANNDLTNSIPITFTVNPGAGQYIVYAYPARLGTATFSVGGFVGGFLGPFTASVTNGSSYNENYSVYRSVNANLGSTTVVVTTP
jgi:hypothetical protein